VSNTEQILSTGIGAVAGFIVGGPPGALAGARYGLLAGAVLFPEELPGITGPRLEDFERAESDPGAPIWKVYGDFAVPGFRMYLGPVTELSNTETQGGKGGGGQDVTTYTYQQTIVLGLCEGPIEGVSRIWENGTLVYDKRPQQVGETDDAYTERIQASNGYELGTVGPFGGPGNGFTLYTGTETQTADPQMEIELGVGNVPGFRGIAYIVFPERILSDDQGRRHPIYKVEVTHLPSVTYEHDFAPSADGVGDWVERGDFDFKTTLNTGFTIVDGISNGFSGSGSGRDGAWPTANLPVGFDPNRFRLTARFYWIASGSGGSAGSSTYLFGIVNPANGYALAAAVSETNPVGTFAYASAGTSDADQPTNASLPVSLAGAETAFANSIPATSDKYHTVELEVDNGECTLTFDDRELDSFTLTAGEIASIANCTRPAILGNSNGNQIVFLSLELNPLAGQGFPLSEIVESICSDVDLTAIDVSDLALTHINGYAVSRQMSARSSIEQLRLVGKFDYVESDAELKFVTRGKPIVRTLAPEDLAPRFSNGERLPNVVIRKIQDFELPRQIRLKYLSLAKGYEKSETLSQPRLGTNAANGVTMEVAVSIDEADASELADIAQRDAWAGRHSFEWMCGCDQDELEGADVIGLPADDVVHRVRIMTATDSGPLMRRFTGVRDDDGVYVSVAIATPPIGSDPVVQLLGETSVELLDLPALDEADDNAGLYLAAWRSGSGSGWSGARLHRSIDGGETFDQVATISEQSIVGEVVTAPTGHTSTWNDATSLVVDVLNEASLSSRTDAAVLSGANTLAVGAHGRWCLIQFANASLIATDQYELTRLLLGRRGTERHLDAIQPGDRVVLVSGPGIYKVGLQSSQIGQVLVYRGVTIGGSLASATDVPFTGAGERLEPFSPVYVRGERDGSDNLTITWIRRDRLEETLPDGIALPLNEASEAYEVDILDDDTSQTVLRTIAGISSPAASYSAAEQTTDFGFPQPEISIRVYQLSATTGRGVPAEVVI
jgi:hypothetical protein